MEAFNIFIDDDQTWIFSNRKKEEIEMLASMFEVSHAPKEIYWPTPKTKVDSVLKKSNGFTYLSPPTVLFDLSDCYIRLWTSKAMAKKFVGAFGIL